MKLKLPDGAFEAYLFDCDGTIVDSMPLHYLAWKKALGHLYNVTAVEGLGPGMGKSPPGEAKPFIWCGIRAKIGA